MQLTITDVDHSPADLHEQVPLVVDLLRQIPGTDRPDYWLGALRTPVRWRVGEDDREVTHVVVSARWKDTQIAPGVRDLPVGLAYVTDESLLVDARLDMTKCAYVAIGISSETGSEPATPAAEGPPAGGPAPAAGPAKGGPDDARGG